MNPPKLRGRFPDDDIEVRLAKVYRLQGIRIPTSPDEVAAAEQRASGSALALPTQLANPPVLPSAILGSHARSRAISFWTHPSVQRLGTDNPVEFIVQKARQLVLSA